MGERAVEMREAHVVAHRHAERAPGQRRRHRALARAIGRRLAIALAARQIDVEHMDLVVARAQRAVGRDQAGPVGEASVLRRHDRPCRRAATRRSRARARGTRRAACLPLRTSPAHGRGRACGSISATHSGSAMRSAPASRASRTKALAAATFASMSPPAFTCTQARRKVALMPPRPSIGVELAGACRARRARPSRRRACRR